MNSQDLFKKSPNAKVKTILAEFLIKNAKIEA